MSAQNLNPPQGGHPLIPNPGLEMADASAPLRNLSAGELITELARVEDTLRATSTAPGYVDREALSPELDARCLVAELRRRQVALGAQLPRPGSGQFSPQESDLTDVPPDLTRHPRRDEPVPGETDGDTSAAATDRPGRRQDPLRSTCLSLATLERERAALDLSDASQAAAQAVIMAGRDDQAESQRLERLAQQLYVKADDHRRLADHLQHTADEQT